MTLEEFTLLIEMESAFIPFRNILKHEPLKKFIFFEKQVPHFSAEDRVIYKGEERTDTGGYHQDCSMETDKDYASNHLLPFQLKGIWIPLNEGRLYHILDDLAHCPLIKNISGKCHILFLIHPTTEQHFASLIEKYRHSLTTISALATSSARTILVALSTNDGQFEPMMVKLSYDFFAHGAHRLLSERECALSVANTSILGRMMANTLDVELEIFADPLSFVPEGFEHGMIFRPLPAELNPKFHNSKQVFLAPLLSLYGVKNLDWFLELAHMNSQGNVTSFLEEKLFEPFLNAFMKLLIQHQAYIQGHGQNLLLKIDQDHQVIGLVYRDMGGVNLEIKKDDVYLPEALKADGLSYFNAFNKDACNVLEQQWINRGLYPLTKQLVKNASIFALTDPEFSHWHQWCLNMEKNGVPVLKNWTTGTATNDEHHVALEQTEFCRYGYVENRFGLKLLEYLQQHHLLSNESLQDLYSQLTCPEQISNSEQTTVLAPCTNVKFFDRAIALTLSHQTTILQSLGAQTMIKKSVLQTLLTSYESKEPTTLTPVQTRLLTTLKNLANNANSAADLTGPIKNLISKYVLPESFSSELSAFDQFIFVLGYHADDARCTYLLESDLADFSSMQTMEIASEAAPAHQIFANTPQGMLEWMRQELAGISTTLDGGYTTNLINRTNNFSLQVHINGPLPMRYICYQMLRKTNAITADSITQGMNAANIDAPIQVNLDVTTLQKTYADYLTFLNIKDFVQGLGFTIADGNKTATEAFSTFTGSTRTEDLKHAFGIDEMVAQRLVSENATIVLPFTFKIETLNDALMEQMEGYFKHELVNLVGANRKPKTFIQETRAPGELHQSNINIMQAKRLKDLFERMEFFSHKLSKSPPQVTEAEMQKETSNILNGLKAGPHSLQNIISSKPLPDDLTRQNTDVAVPHIMNWIVGNAGATSSGYAGMFAPTLLTPKQFSKDMEDYLNKTLLPSPTFFLDDSPLLQNLSRICGAHNSDFSIFSYNEELSVDPEQPTWNCKTPKSPVPRNLYARAIAKHCLSPTGRKFKIVEDDEMLNAQASQWIDKIVNRTTNGTSANQPLLDFYTKNSAYYIVDTIVSQICGFLDDNVHCDEAAVANVLLAVGLSNETLTNFQMSDNHQFNRFQIKLMLLPLVTNALVENNLLLNIDKLYAENHKWISQTIPRNYGPSIERTNSAAGWHNQMVNFKLNEIAGKSYGCGGPASTSSNSYKQQTTERNSFHSGGAQGETRKVKETTQSNHTYGG